MELVGKYSAFEEIDLADYLAVRDRAVRLIAAEDPYAAILISMHTYSLLSEHADRSTIAPAELPLLDQFLEQQKEFQQALRNQIAADASLRRQQKSDERDPRSFPAAAGERQSLAADVRGFSRARRTCCIRCRCAMEATRASRCARRARGTSFSTRTRSASAR